MLYNDNYNYICYVIFEIYIMYVNRFCFWWLNNCILIVWFVVMEYVVNIIYVGMKKYIYCGLF